MEKAKAVIHDVALALVVGGIAAVGVAAGAIFGSSPTREIAGQIGNDLFGTLGPAVLGLSLVVLAARLLLQSGEPTSRVRTASLICAVLMALMAAVLALWLTPRMNTIWTGSPHAPDGSGLDPGVRGGFMILHGISNLLYLGIMLLGITQIILRTLLSRARG